MKSQLAYQQIANAVSGGKPGTIGGIPYLALLRVLVGFGIFLRFSFHGGPPSVSWYYIGWLLLGCSTLFSFSIGERWLPHLARHAVIIGCDIASTTIFYRLTGAYESDFFLFYFVPILSAAEYLGGRYVFACLALISLAFAFTVLSLAIAMPGDGASVSQILMRVFVPRELFVLLVGAVYAVRMRLERQAHAERAGLQEALREVATAASSVIRLNEHIDSMFQRLEDWGFGYATVSLVDEYMDRVYAVRGRNVPPGWIARASHSLQSNDIQAAIVRNRNLKVLTEYEESCDKAIWERFHHDELARVFAPIFHLDQVVGTIEAACKKEEQAKVLTRENIERVRDLGHCEGEVVALTKPQALLELAATRVVEHTKADSASIHVFKRGTQLLRAGAGKATVAFLLDNPPSDSGIGRGAMSDHQPRCHNTPLPPNKQKLIRAGVQAYAAFGLSLGPEVQGVLYIHHFSPYAFSITELHRIAETLVPSIESAIQNHLLFDRFTLGDEREAMTTCLKNVIQTLSSDLPLEALLQDLALNALYMLDAKNVTLYQYFENQRRFSHPPVREGSFMNPEALDMEVHSDDVIYDVVRNGHTRFITTVSDSFLRQDRADQIDRPRFAEREGIHSTAILVLKCPHDGEIVGCLFANYTEPRDFDGPEGRPLQGLARLLASSAASAIKSARLRDKSLARKESDLSRTRSQLEALGAINRALQEFGTTANLEQVCEVLLERVFSVFSAHAADVTLWDPMRGQLRVVSHKGYPDQSVPEEVDTRTGIVGWVAEKMTLLRCNDVQGDPRYRLVSPETRSEMACALRDCNELLGVINVEHPSVNGFTDKDEVFLEALATQTVIAINGVRMYDKLQKQVEQALSLSKVAGRIQQKDLDLQTVLLLLLTGITAGRGLGFSRAMLFMVDHERGLLRGELAIGGKTRAEAEAAWCNAEKSFDETLNAAELLASNLKNGDAKDSSLSSFLRSFAHPLSNLTGAFKDCLANPQPGVYVIKAGHPDQLRSLLSEAYESGGLHCAIVCVPICLQGQTTAILVADKHFLFEQTTIDSMCEPVLRSFAELTSICIQKTRMSARLAEELQLANWRQATLMTAHKFKGRVVAIEMAQRKVARAIRSRLYADADAALDEVADAIDAARSLQKEFTRFATPRSPLLFSQVDLREPLESIVSTFREAVSEIDWQFQAQPVPLWVKADPSAIPDMFTDLLENARKVLRFQGRGDGRVTVTCSLDGANVVVEVQDNGPGVPQNLIDRIYEPFVSGAPVDAARNESSGVGLTIIRELVTLHGGMILHAVPEGGGACFRITLPFSCDGPA